ncbi:MAG: DUF4845 domain-containing protein [Sedimenticolaceae bacterium]|nr:DUF4845 domain-containing protein [Sedimenticolaceae bacterium]
MKKQQGLSIIGLLIILLMAGALGFFGLKVGPTYMENWTLKKMMNDLRTDDAVIGKNPNTIRNAVMKRIRVNGVYSLSPKNVNIKRQGSYNVVTLDYSVTKKLAGNMDVVMTFKEIANVPASP